MGSKTILATTVITNLLLRSTISQIWGMINALQIIAYMTYLNVYFPANVEIFFGFIINLSEFDIFPTADILHFIFPFLEELDE